MMDLMAWSWEASEVAMEEVGFLGGGRRVVGGGERRREEGSRRGKTKVKSKGLGRVRVYI